MAPEISIPENRTEQHVLCVLPRGMRFEVRDFCEVRLRPLIQLWQLTTPHWPQMTTNVRMTATSVYLAPSAAEKVVIIILLANA